jgi:hypothetical protein
MKQPEGTFTSDQNFGCGSPSRIFSSFPAVEIDRLPKDKARQGQF